MENAIYLDYHKIPETSPGRYDRLYTGSEFCENLIPMEGQIRDALSFCDEYGLAFTFVTPPCTERGIMILSKIFQILPGSTEVVFNDWGVFDIMKDLPLVPIHGRLLTSMIKDPRIQIIPEGESDEETDAYLRCSNISNPEYQRFLILNGITRVEYDNVWQGCNLWLLPEMNATLHYPFVCSSMTRRCWSSNVGKPIGLVGLCKNNCISEKLYAYLGGNKICLRGTITYYRNDVRPKEEFLKGFNRLVFSPEIQFANQ